MSSNTTLNVPSGASAGALSTALQKWGALASWLLALAYLVPPFVYVTGDLQAPLGPLAYGLADFLSGPLWAASLVLAVFALRERLGQRAPRRMSLALLAAVLAAGAMLSVALIRSANRQYHLLHPELHLEDSTPVLVVWTTVVAGLAGVGWHCLGWSLILAGSAGWTSRLMPRVLAVLFLIAGSGGLFVYLRPEFEGVTLALGAVVSVWQGAVLWRRG